MTSRTVHVQHMPRVVSGACVSVFLAQYILNVIFIVKLIYSTFFTKLLSRSVFLNILLRVFARDSVHGLFSLALVKLVVHLVAVSDEAFCRNSSDAIARFPVVTYDIFTHI